VVDFSAAAKTNDVAGASLDLPTYEDVCAAARRIESHAYRTPVLRSQSADEMLGARVFFKCENFQRTGAFKFRGAFNALSQFNAAQRQAGVVAFSSGNHAQAIALAARLLGIRASIIMPHDSSPSKLAATRNYGAEVIFYDRYTEDRMKTANALAQNRGMTIIPPYDHPHVMAGQATAAKELFEEVGPCDALFVCLGGGGLLSGSALSTRALSPNALIYGAEPEAGDDGRQSFIAKKLVKIDTPRTIADGAQTQRLGELPFEIIKREISDIVTVSDAELATTMRFFMERLKITVEPTGCLSFAAAQKVRTALAGKRVGIIVSGGNIDAARFAEIIGTFAN
jgi:threonine dehydratase